MNTLDLNPSTTKVWFDESALWLSLRDGRQLSVPLAYFPVFSKRLRRNETNSS